MRILIFDIEAGGHHLEYVHNLYEACNSRLYDEFVFALPQIDFEHTEYSWPSLPNASFYFLNDKEVAKCKGGMAKRCLYESFLIRRVAKQNAIDQIILIHLAPVVPILPLILSNRVKLSGIIYQIYLWKIAQNKIRRAIDYLRYTVLARNRSVERVFILNDEKSAEELNRIYHTEKFIPIPDPLPEVEMSELDLRDELGVSEDGMVFLHFGAMSERKGTLDILRAIKLIPKNRNVTFIFAGKIGKDIENEFNELYADAIKFHRIIVINEFCSYSYLYALCRLSHCILIPYHIVSQSSGLIGHAAKHNLPVIGPEKGLIGYLIKKYNLGICLDEITPDKISMALQTFVPYKTNSDYAKINAITDFQKVIMNT